jgi:urate oxidase
MSPELVDSHYGKSRIRLLKVARFPDHHMIHDWTVDLSMRGDFDAAFVTGDNRNILPTDSMKNTVYALAHGHAGERMEPFGRRLVEHFLHQHPQISQVLVTITAPAWEPIVTDGTAHPHAFCRRSGETRVAEVSGSRDSVTLTSGIEGLAVTKTAGSQFVGFAKDQFTTLADDTDRVLATEIHARWTYRGAGVGGDPETDYDECWEGVRRALLERFANHESASLQQTLHSLASAVLESSESIADIRISMPNRHCLFVDLASFGFENDGEIFMPTEAPYGLIEAHIART